VNTIPSSAFVPLPPLTRKKDAQNPKLRAVPLPSKALISITAIRKQKG
jgi:hypothetical protein